MEFTAIHTERLIVRAVTPEVYTPIFQPPKDGIYEDSVGYDLLKSNYFA